MENFSGMMVGNTKATGKTYFFTFICLLQGKWKITWQVNLNYNFNFFLIEEYILAHHKQKNLVNGIMAEE